MRGAVRPSPPNMGDSAFQYGEGSRCARPEADVASTHQWGSTTREQPVRRFITTAILAALVASVMREAALRAGIAFERVTETVEEAKGVER